MYRNFQKSILNRIAIAITLLLICCAAAFSQVSFCSPCNCIMIHAFITVLKNQTVDVNTLYSGNTYWTLANGQYSPTTNASGLNCAVASNPNPLPSWTIYTTSCPPNSTCVDDTSTQIRVAPRNMKPKCAFSCCPTNPFNSIIYLEADDDLTSPTSSTTWSQRVCRPSVVIYPPSELK